MHYLRTPLTQAVSGVYFRMSVFYDDFDFEERAADEARFQERMLKESAFNGWMERWRELKRQRVSSQSSTVALLRKPPLDKQDSISYCEALAMKMRDCELAVMFVHTLAKKQRANRMALLASVSADLAAGWTYDAKHYPGMKHWWHGRVTVRWWECYPALAARARGQERGRTCD